jgi:hypothetical protein
VIVQWVRAHEKLNISQFAALYGFPELQRPVRLATQEIGRANSIDNNGYPGIKTLARAEGLTSLPKPLLEENVELGSANDVNGLVASMRIPLVQLCF